jgi:hypothetical protein
MQRLLVCLITCDGHNQIDIHDSDFIWTVGPNAAASMMWPPSSRTSLPALIFHSVASYSSRRLPSASHAALSSSVSGNNYRAMALESGNQRFARSDFVLIAKPSK